MGFFFFVIANDDTCKDEPFNPNQVPLTRLLEKEGIVTWPGDTCESRDNTALIQCAERIRDKASRDLSKNWDEAENTFILQNQISHGA